MTIYVEYDLDANAYVLMCADGKMGPMPCGQRLFRAEPYPEIIFRHESMEDAERDAAVLRAYLATKPKNKPSEGDARKMET